MPDKKWGEVGLIILLLEGDKQVSEDELKEYCQGKLARFKIPKKAIFVDDLPYSAYGKVEKEKLKAKYL
jgi:fatty-acyl-CoA synthase